MREWPPITHPELLERLAMADEQFIAYFHEIWNTVGAREVPPTAVERALGYPWERPGASYVLRGDDVELLDGADPGAVHRRSPSTAGLWRQCRAHLVEAKFAHFPDEEDRTVLVLAGELHDFDVGPAASLAPFGYMPATLFASPGTAVRASIVWVTGAQATQLTWSEIPYRLVRLDDAHFHADEADVDIDQIFAYSIASARSASTARRSRWRDPGGQPHRRRVDAAELLDIAAGLVLGADARAEDLVRAVFEDMAGVTTRASQTIWPRTQHLQSSWTPFPARGEVAPASGPCRHPRRRASLPAVPLLLWDIDGTLLLKASLEHAQAIHAAIERVYGVDIPQGQVEAAGRTDFAIARSILTLAGVSAQRVDERLGDLRAAAVEEYARRVPADLSEHVAPHVPEVLDELDSARTSATRSSPATSSRSRG